MEFGTLFVSFLSSRHTSDGLLETGDVVLWIFLGTVRWILQKVIFVLFARSPQTSILVVLLGLSPFFLLLSVSLNFSRAVDGQETSGRMAANE